MKNGEDSSGQKRVITIIPHYNYHHYLFQAIDSCINQTYNNHFTCVIDDFSKDPNKVLEIVFEQQGLVPDLVKSYPDYTYVWHDKVSLLLLNENGGAVRARNFGIKHHFEDTDAFIFLDAHDYVELNKVEKYVKEMQEDWDNIGLIYGDYFLEKEDGSKYHKYTEPYSLKSIYEKCIIPCNGLVNKKVFESVGLFDESFRASGDFNLWQRMSIHKPYFQCVHIPTPYSTVRNHTQNSTNTVLKEV